MDALEARAVSYRLRRNCRNTRQIAIATSILSGTPLGETMSAEGPDVVEAWYSDERTYQKATNRLLNTWLERGVRAEDVIVLAPEHCLTRCSRRFGSPDRSWMWAPARAPTRKLSVLDHPRLQRARGGRCAAHGI